MSLATFFQSVEDSAIGTAMRSNELLFPVVESLHVVALATVVGTIAFVDLRLMGFGAAKKSVSATLNDVLPITRIAFVITLLTGLMLFTSSAVNYSQNIAFLIKMALLAAALANIVFFHHITAKDIARWDTAAQLPIAVKAAGASSLILWIGVVAAGRWIGFL
jgi:hypothetical protein